MSGKSRLVLASAMVVLLCGLLAAPGQAAFPGANGKIAFTTDQYDGDQNIYSISPDRTGLTRLTANPGDDDDAAWSPDGKRIAFSSNRAHPDIACEGLSPVCDYDIYVMNADGKKVKRLTTDPGSDRDPAWSPDGTQIVFSSTRDYSGEVFGESYTSELYVMKDDGSGQARITDDPGIDQNAAWSPDGTRIAFKRAACEFNCISHIFKLAPDGSEVVQLTDLTDPAPYDRKPNWAPDGSKLVFERDLFINSFWIMNPDGTDQTRMPGSNLDPAWSPDGLRIAHGAPGIGFMNPDGGDPVLVTPYGETPDWQPLVPPRRADYKSSQGYCHAEREFLGREQFAAKYGGRARALRNCVRANR